MIRLIYTSTASHELNKDELISMLEQARERNEQHDITGMLLYTNGCFFQVLEGDAAEVDLIYKSIVKDSRNFGNIVLVKDEIEERAFPNWSMGFRHISKTEMNQLQGFTNFMNVTQKELGEDPSIVMKLLYQFKENS